MNVNGAGKVNVPSLFHWHWLAWINVWSVVKYDQFTFFTFKQINTIFLPCLHIGWCKYLRCFRANCALSKNELAVLFESSFIAQAVSKIKDFTSFSCYTPPSSFTFSFFQAWCMDVVIMRNSRPCCVCDFERRELRWNFLVLIMNYSVKAYQNLLT